MIIIISTLELKLEQAAHAVFYHSLIFLFSFLIFFLFLQTELTLGEWAKLTEFKIECKIFCKKLSLFVKQIEQRAAQR